MTGRLLLPPNASPEKRRVLDGGKAPPGPQTGQSSKHLHVLDAGLNGRIPGAHHQLLSGAWRGGKGEELNVKDPGDSEGSHAAG